MPNHVTNVLEITGDKEIISKMKEAVKNNEQIFSLNSIIPMPASLDIDAGSETDRDLQAYMWSIGEKEKVKKHFDEYTDEDLEKFAETYFKDCDLKKGKLAYDNLKEYGFANWYAWRIATWGTKWEAYEVSEEWYEDGEATCVEFQTAWSPPMNVMEELSEKFPTLTFKLKYIDEGIGFLGYAIFHDCDVKEDVFLENEDAVSEEGKKLAEELGFSYFIFDELEDEEEDTDESDEEETDLDDDSEDTEES